MRGTNDSTQFSWRSTCSVNRLRFGLRNLPADVTEELTKFELVIDLKTANALWPYDSTCVRDAGRWGDSKPLACGAAGKRCFGFERPVSQNLKANFE